MAGKITITEISGWIRTFGGNLEHAWRAAEMPVIAVAVEAVAGNMGAIDQRNSSTTSDITMAIEDIRREEEARVAAVQEAARKASQNMGAGIIR